ncbi:MAG: deoxyhypusine synthase [Archaeoglobaceae archaeon]|nr:deoxyhypusine synthase [Archaeoglobaceae archaeon]
MEHENGEKIEPIFPANNVIDLIDAFSNTAFNAKRMGEAAKIYKEMVESKSFIFFTMAGAMIPAGMRLIVTDAMKNGFLDVFVTTGANIVHEVVESLGIGHYKGDANVDDVELANSNINRIYDVFLPQRAFEELENFVSPIISELDGKYTTFEFLWEIGKRIEDKNSFLRIAYERKIPIFCPTLHDSILGLHVAIYRKKLEIDLFKDVYSMLDLCYQKKKFGVVIVGGGVPKNFTLQAMLLNEGFDYAIQITTDSPHWGGLSGATLEEAKSWCKLKENAKAVTVYCDATIALPLIYSYLKFKD